MGVDTLPLVVAEDHLLRFSLDGGDLYDFLAISARANCALFLASELLDTAAIDLEFVVAEATFVLSGVLVV